MAKVADVCRHVRSKNAGPFWITVDFFFKSQELYAQYRDSAVLRPALFERLYGANPKLVKRLPVDNLMTLKIAYARPHPQGWMGERDMHGGQQYASLLDVELD